MRSTTLGALLFALVLTSFAIAAMAASGELDPTFGDGGIARTSFGGSAESALARQPDGKLVVAGAVGVTPDVTAIGVARFDTSGVLDPTFNGTGQVTTDIGAFHDGAVQVLIQPDGKIVVVGTTDTVADGSDANIVVVRYNDDGTLDGGFGSGGIVTTDLGVGTDFAFAGALQSDGKILVVGGGAATSTPSDEFVIRYTSNGAIDLGFGLAGVVTLDFGGRNDGGRAVLAQSDGKIIVAGTSFNGPLFLDGGVATLTRLDATGTPDPTFGTGGSVVFAPQPINLFDALVRQADGKLVALGATGPGAVTFRLFRFDETGSADGAFVGDAIPFFLTNVNPDSLGLAPDGKFVVAGFSTPGFHVARLKGDGTLDDSFAVGGTITINTGLPSVGQSVVVEPSLDVIVAGTATKEPNGTYECTLVRLAGSSPSCATDADCGVCDRCGTGGTCEIGQRSGCTVAGTKAAQLAVAEKGFKNAGVSLSWKGTVPAVDPVASDDIGICLYQTGRRIVEVVAPAGGVCRSKPCWTGSFATKLKYRDPDGTPHGVRTASITGGIVKMKAKGLNLAGSPQGLPDPLTLGPLSSPVVLQVHASNGECVAATFDTMRTAKPGRFKGKSD
jgi:uncharacterized delta-60 repeat protein